MMYSHIEVVSPKTIADALKALRDEGKRTRVVSGGTDVAVYIKDGLLKEPLLLDISHVEDLRYIREEASSIRVGAAVTLSECLMSPLVNAHAPLLNEGAREVGSLQIRNLATLVGNVCNASPAADTLPPLYALEASVVLQSAMGKREMELRDFILGPRRTARRQDELLTEVRIPKMRKGDAFFFKKLGLRSSQAISVASVAALIRKRDNRIALGAVGPTVIRARRAEKYLFHNVLSLKCLRRVCFLVSREASPIDDLRGSAQYRREALWGLAYQGFYEVLRGGGLDR